MVSSFFKAGLEAEFILRFPTHTRTTVEREMPLGLRFRQRQGGRRPGVAGVSDRELLFFLDRCKTGGLHVRHRSAPGGSTSGFLHATLLNLGLRLVVVDRIEMWMSAQNAPHEFFPDVVDTRVRVDLDLVGAFGTLEAA
jgi:hypothetical protein